ncbi:MAG: WYL domain-containing protein [Muribaculaceae bacterium]|nr:WYL domain-containing protein [Muribaculaceae bacterium]
MNKNLIARYIWLADALSSHGKLTRAQLNDLWLKSNVGDGNPLPERTFYHYRRAVEEIFKVEIACNSRGEYYVERGADRASNGMTDWLLDSFAINNLLADSPDIADRIEVEEVPSAREFLPAVIAALRAGAAIRFDYAGFNRSMTEKSIEFHPYFLKRYKQRWYMIGRRVKSADLRTYALDRVKAVEETGDHFELPAGLTIGELFGNILGVTSSKAEERTVRLHTTRTQAKYFRALPLHHSQEEELTGPDHSIFKYRLKLNYELVHELMSLGDGVKVLEPRELQLMVTNELKKALEQYDNP